MTEKILVSHIVEKGKWTLLDHAILQSIGVNKDSNKVFEKMGKDDKGQKYMTVYFSINGVEIHFSSFMAEFESQLDRMIKEEAANMIAKHLHDVSATTDALNKAIADITFKKLGIHLSEYRED
jgi:hypothetical protein